MKKILSFILSFFLLVNIVPFSAMAIGEATTPKIQYTLGEGGEKQQATLTEIGTWSPSAKIKNQPVYLCHLPTDAIIQTTDVSPYESWQIYCNNAKVVTNTKVSTSFTFSDGTSGGCISDPGKISYITGEQFIGRGDLNKSSQYYKTFLGKLDSPNETEAKIPCDKDLYGYVLRLTSGKSPNQTAPCIIIQFGEISSVERIDTSALYEALHRDLRWGSGGSGNVSAPWPAPKDYSGNWEKISESNTTLESWKAYQAALSTAQDLLNSLYDENGEPTEANQSSNTELVKQVKDAAAELNLTNAGSAVSGLERRIESSGIENQLPDAQGKYDLLKALLQRYDPAAKGLSESDYTPESWAALQNALEAARSFCAAHDRPTAETGQRTYQALGNAYEGLRTAWDQLKDQLKDQKNAITVTVTVSDNTSARGNTKWMPQAKAYTLTLDAEHRTLEDLLAKLEIDKSVWTTSRQGADYDGLMGMVFRNGMLVDTPISSYDFCTTNILDAYNQSIVLRDGDHITLARLDQLMKKGSSGAGYDAAVTNSYPYFRSSALTGPDEVKQGEIVDYSASSMAAYEGYYTGRSIALAGATVFVSPAAAASADTVQAATEKTDVVTDENGAFSYAFYAPGYYCVSVYPLGKNTNDAQPGLTAGCTMLVHVTETEAGDQAETRARLQAELDACYNAYPESYFTPEAWQELNSAYTTGTDGIANSTTLVESKAALDTALSQIEAIQSEASTANEIGMEQFRQQLSKLPDDVTRLTQGQATLMAELIAKYDALSEYAKNQLISSESDKYTALLAAYGTDGSGLPEPVAYTLDVVLQADNEEDLAVLQALSQKCQEQDEDHLVNRCYQIVENDGKYEYALLDSCYPGESVRFDQELFYYLQTTLRRYPDWIEELKTAVPGFDYKSGSSVKWLINGTAYELKKISVTGTDNFSGYSFKVPYENATVTVTYGKADEISTPSDEDILKEAKETAIATLKATYEGYQQDKYSAENWTKLTGAYKSGLTAIENAANTDDVTEARQEAIRTMAAVKTIAQENSDAQQGGASHVKLPDYGDVVGQVHIILENKTFTTAASDGSIPAWYGTLIDGWYDLCEEDTMMTSVLKALQLKGCNWSTGSQGVADSWDDYGISYIASIKVPEDVKADGSFHVNDSSQRLGEFSGEAGSGWMGTLNDWFTNYGFNQFSYANGQLENGDEIHIMFTQNLGVDLGGTWGNSDTSLKSLTVSGGGKLYPTFSSDVTDYAYVISGSSTNLTITPTAANKNYQVRTYLNTYNNDASFYKRTQKVPVKAGDTVYVGCGEYSWPSMNNQETEARPYTGTKYSISIYNSLGEYVKDSITKLPAASGITLSNYKNYAEQLDTVKSLYNGLSSTEKSKVTNSAKLSEVEARITSCQEIDNVKSLLAALPDSSKATDAQVKAAKSAIESADRAYKALNTEQKGYITVGDYKNYNALVERLSGLTSTSASPITKNPNEEAASEVIGLIEAIGTVTKDSGSKITAARKAYDALTDAQKKLVTNYSVLTKAEAAFAKLSGGLPFTDVKESDYFHDAVAWALEKGITNGTTDTTFSPNKSCTRAQMVTFLWRAAGSPEPADKTNPFTDVNGDAYYFKALLWAIENGITNGTSATTFSPDATCTRGQMVAFLYRRAKTPAVSGSVSFTDVTDNDYFSDAVVWAVQGGITNGTTATTFSPYNNCTRGQMVTFLYRYLAD